MRTFTSWERVNRQSTASANSFTWLLNASSNYFGLFQNGKVINTNGNSKITVTSPPTNLVIQQLVYLQSGLYVVGSADINGKPGSIGIWRLDFTYDREVLNYVEIAVDDSTESTLDCHVTAVGVDETEEVATIYINRVLGETKLESAEFFTCNVLAPNPVLINNETTFIDLPAPIVTAVPDGKLEQGVYEYAYRLIEKNGAVTKWSALSTGQVAVLEDLDNWVGFEAIDTLANYQAAPTSSTGYKVELPTLPTNLKFTHAEICQIHYYLPNVSPKVEIKELINLSETSSIYLNNNTVRSILSVAEFVAELDSKSFAFFTEYQNKMFAANLVSSTFTVDASSVTIKNTVIEKLSTQEYDIANGSYKDKNKGASYTPTKGLQQGSTYRIGVVYIDETGKYSDVKNVQDYTIPYGNGLATVSGDKLSVQNLEITLQEVPANATKAFLVHVPRKMEDRPIISVGVGYFSNEYLDTDTENSDNHLVIFSPEHLIGNVDLSKVDTKLKILNKVTTTNAYTGNSVKIDTITAGEVNEFTEWKTNLKNTVDAEPLEKSILNRSTSTPSAATFTRQERTGKTAEDIGQVCSKSLICGTKDLIGILAKATSGGCDPAYEYVNTGDANYSYYIADAELSTFNLDWLTYHPSKKHFYYELKLGSSFEYTQLSKIKTNKGTVISNVVLGKATITNTPVTITESDGTQLILSYIEGDTPPTRSNSIVQIQQDVVPFGGTDTLNSPQQEFVKFSEVEEIATSFTITERTGELFIYGCPLSHIKLPMDTADTTQVYSGTTLCNLEEGHATNRKTTPLQYEIEIFNDNVTIVRWVYESVEVVKVIVDANNSASYTSPEGHRIVTVLYSTYEREVQGTTLTTIGDTYVDFCVMQTKARARTDATWDTDLANAEYIVVPVESSVNPRMVGDGLLNLVAAKSTTLKHLDYKDNTKVSFNSNSVQEEFNINSPDLYTASSLYSSIDNIRKFVIIPDIVDTSTHFPLTVKYSERKFSGEFVNNYLRYKVNNKAILDGKYGQFTNFIVFQDKLVAFQERAMHRLRVNELSQTIDTNGNVLALGAGDIIGSAGGKVSDIIATEVGCSFHSNIIKSKSSLYWIDSNNRHLYRWLGGNEIPQAISLTNGIHDLMLVAIKKTTKLVGGYDSSTGDVYLTIQNKDSNGDLILVENYTVTSIENVSYATITNVFGEVGHSAVDLALGTTITIQVEGIPVLMNIDFIGSTYFRGRIKSTVVPIVGNKVSMLEHVKYMLNFTIVYSEIKNAFTNVLSLYAKQFIAYEKDLFSIPVEETEASVTGATLYKHTDATKNEFFGTLYPSVISFVLNGAKAAVWKHLSMFTEYHTLDANEELYSRDGSINKTWSYIKISKLHRTSDMLEILPKKSEFLRSSRVGSNFDTIKDQTQPNRSIPYSFDKAEDSLIPHLYNIEKVGDEWKLTLPRVKMEQFPGTSPVFNTPTSDRNFYEFIRSNWIQVTLYYTPSNNTDVITLNDLT